MLHLRHGGEAPAVHLLMRDADGALAGYAHVDTTDEVDGPSAELVVHPLRRRRGLGRALVKAAVEAAAEADPAGRLRLWAHGDHPSAGALALGLGFARARVLWQMRRSLFAPVPEPVLPDGRAAARRSGPAWTTRPGWRSTPAPSPTTPTRAAGRWRDLRVRMAEPWFDPAGFLLAVRRRPTTTCSASTGRRCTARCTSIRTRAAPHRTTTSRSARCTCSASTRRRTGWAWAPR